MGSSAVAKVTATARPVSASALTDSGAKAAAAPLAQTTAMGTELASRSSTSLRTTTAWAPKTPPPNTTAPGTPCTSTAASVTMDTVVPTAPSSNARLTAILWEATTTATDATAVAADSATTPPACANASRDTRDTAA